MGIFRQFPYSNFHEMNMDEVLKILKTMEEEWNATKAEWASYKDFIDNYFANLDVSQEVLNAIRTMARDGSLNEIIDPVIASSVTAWLNSHVTPTTPIIDDSLTISGAGADSKTVGDRFNIVENDAKVINREIINTAIPIVLTDDWEMGIIRPTDGSDYDNDAQIRTPFYVFNGNIIFKGVVQGPNELYGRVIYAYFYDSDKNYIDRINMYSGGNNKIKSPDNAYYVRFCYGFAEISGLKVVNYGLERLANDWVTTFEIPNTETFTEYGTMGAMMCVAETYLNQAYNTGNQIVYDSGYGIYTDPVNGDGIKATVCSQFMKSLLMGTPYEFSRYVQTENSEAWWSYEYDSSTTAVFADTGRGYLPSDQIAKYCDEKNILIPFDINHDNTRPGDVMFWTENDAVDKYLNVIHCAICLYKYWGGCYVVHASRNITRPIDGETVGVEVQRMDYTTHAPSYYARLPLIPGEYKYQLLYENPNEYIGTYTGTSASITNIDFSENLPIGLYTLIWEDTGNGNSYAKINPSGINANIEACKQGDKYYIILYATEPITRINMRSGRGNSFNLKNLKIYKGYKTVDIL